MGQLIYLTNTTLDGYIEDDDGAFDLYEPDDDVFAATTDLIRPCRMFLYGRRLYETMAVWETEPALAEQSAAAADFAAAWQAAGKVVYSTTLTTVSTTATTLESDFDPVAVHKLKDATDGELIIGGADLAAQAFAARLVDEYRLFVWPMVISRGKPAVSAGIRTGLELLGERRFNNGVVYLRYRVGPPVRPG